MSTFREFKAQFRAGQIDKPTFIESMHLRHQVLFETSQNLEDCNIGEIRITQAGVIATFKDPQISMLCPASDLRIAPIEAFNFGDYEHDEIQLVRTIVKNLGGAQTRFFDIGANAGFYSLALSKYFPGIVGTAFEPIPQTFSYLQQNLQINGPLSVTPRNLGLSNQSSQLVFHTYPSQSGASSMTRNIDSPDAIEVRCDVITLDSYCAAHPQSVDFIKCDVEGAELFVFQGASEVLKRDQPVVFTEMLRKWCAKYEYHPNDIIALFNKLEYDCYLIRGTRLQATRSITEETRDTNFLFLHRTKHAALIEAFTK